MSKYQERLIELIELIVKSVCLQTDSRTVIIHLRDMLQEVKFNPDDMDDKYMTKFEDTLCYSLYLYLMKRLISENSDSYNVDQLSLELTNNLQLTTTKKSEPKIENKKTPIDLGVKKKSNIPD